MFGCYRILCRLLKRDSEAVLRHEPRIANHTDPFRSERRKLIIRSKILSGIRARISQENEIV